MDAPATFLFWIVGREERGCIRDRRRCHKEEEDDECGKADGESEREGGRDAKGRKDEKKWIYKRYEGKFAYFPIISTWHLVHGLSDRKSVV